MRREFGNGQRNGETNCNNKFEYEKIVPKWPQRICQFIARKQISVLEYAPYSPDLPLYKFFLYQKLKSLLKGTHFQSVENIHKKRAELLKSAFTK
jgi:hypothetical protein